MLLKVHYFLSHIKGPKAVIKNLNRNEITFPKTDSMFYIGTAGAKKFGRGDTITDLHCSEVAYWPDPVGLMTGLMQAVPRSGEVALESTGNGVGNYYHRAVMRAYSGHSRYRLHFFNWQDFKSHINSPEEGELTLEYNVPLTQLQEDEVLSNLDETTNEEELVHKYGLTAGQIVYRREKLEELDYDVTRFRQEYPLTLDECFQASGSSIFGEINYIQTPDWEKYDRFLHLLKGHPQHGRMYIMGGDVSAGVGQDKSIIEIFDLQTLEQVGEWADDRIEPDVFGHKLNMLGRWFNDAFITVECNNHGIVTLQALRDGKSDENIEPYPSHMLYREVKKLKRGANQVEKLFNLGFRTTMKSKPFVIGKLRRYLNDDMVIHSEVLQGELNSYVENSTGGLEAEEGCFDDRVMACAMMLVGVEKSQLLMLPSTPAPYVPRLEDDPFCLEAIMSELNAKNNPFPIRGQTLIN